MNNATGNCCNTMASQVKHNCDQHPDPDQCPDKLVWYKSDFNEYGLPIRDGKDGHASSYLRIEYCPWCGQKLPESKRN